HFCGEGAFGVGAELRAQRLDQGTELFGGVVRHVGAATDQLADHGRTGIDVTGGRHGGHDESLHGALLGEGLRGGGAAASSAGPAARARSPSHDLLQPRPPASISLAGSAQASGCSGGHARRWATMRRIAWRRSTSPPRYDSSTTAALSPGNSEG